MDPATAIESQRLTSILEIAIDKLSILASLTTDFQNEELTQMLGEEISRIIHEQRELEVKYEELIQMRGQLKALSNKTKSKQNEEEIQAVAQALQQSTKLLCRNLQDNPNLEGNLQKIHSDRGVLETLLVKTVHELQHFHFSSLEEKVEGERARWEHKKEVLAREKELSVHVASLREELANEKKEFEREVTAKTEMLSKLKEELQEMKAKTTIETKYMSKENAAFVDCQQRVFAKEEADLEETLAKLETKINIEKRASQMTEEFLKKKIGVMADKTEAWNTRYDKELSDRTAEFEKLKQRRESDMLRLKEMEDKYQQDVSERNARAAEERRQIELRRIKEAELQRTNAAATLIQCNVRVWLAKARVQDIKHPKKKKGKKGKGKGKGGAKGGAKGKKGKGKK